MLDRAASGAAAAGLGAAGLGAAGRLAVAGLVPGGSLNFKVGGIGVNLNLAGGLPDWRLRISLADSANYFYHSANKADRGIMSPLFGSQTQNGVIFPYTPSVQVTHTANYSQQKFTHSNHPGYYYENSEVAAITISGDFTVQNIEEGQYLLAAIYFFRSCTKMFVGNDALAGNPPPIVYLDGYGDFYFPHVSCVVTSFQHTMPADCDYVQVPYTAGQTFFENNGAASALSQQSVRLPTTSQLSVTLQPIYSRKNTHDNFTLTDFSKGNLLKGKGGFL